MSLGLGVLIGILDGNRETVETLSGAIGKMIVDLRLTDDVLCFAFVDGSKMQLFDDGQSCCEERYMHTDDELSDFVNTTLLNVEIRDVPDELSEWGVHEVQFLLVTTNKGVFTMASHNEHNGYYGGFMIRAVVVD